MTVILEASPPLQAGRSREARHRFPGCACRLLRRASFFSISFTLKRAANETDWLRAYACLVPRHKSDARKCSGGMLVDSRSECHWRPFWKVCSFSLSGIGATTMLPSVCLSLALRDHFFFLSFCTTKKNKQQKYSKTHLKSPKNILICPAIVVNMEEGLRRLPREAHRRCS